MTIHERLDLERWLKEFPLERMVAEKKALGEKHGYEVRDDWLPGGSIIRGPQDLAKVEHTRRALIARGHDLGRAAPTDIFLWRIGKLSKGPVTRIGGEPFRDSSKPWPEAKRRGLRGKLERKRPLPFLAQISFLDSQDVVPSDLPGDVLCLYGTWSGKHNIDADSIAFEWVEAARGEDAAFLEIPDVPAWPFCAEGVIHRTVSYPDCYDKLLDLEIPSPYSLNCFQATSIGPCAHFIQGQPDHLDTLVAVFSSFQATDRWPFINCPDIPRFTYPKGHEGMLDDIFSVMMSDMGSLYFFKDMNGKYTRDWDCY